MIVTPSSNRFNVNHGVFSIPLTRYCKELEDVIAVAKSRGYIIPGDYILKQINFFINELKLNRIWNTKDLVFLLGHNSLLDQFNRITNPSSTSLYSENENLTNFGLIDLKNPFTYRGIFTAGSGDGIYAPFKNQYGFLRSSVTGINRKIYINYIAKDNAINWQQNNASFSAYISPFNTAISSSYINSQSSSLTRRTLGFNPSNGTNATIAINTTPTVVATTIANTITSGFFYGERTASNLNTLYLNGTSIGTTTKASQTITSTDYLMLYGLVDDGTYSGGTIGSPMSYFSLGSAITSLQKTEYQIFIEYKTRLGYGNN